MVDSAIKKSADIFLNLHAILPRSRANGPGVRMAVWFQGCTLACPGCFNPKTHALALNRLVTVEALLQKIIEADGEIEGITISGGEPLLQSEGLYCLLAGVRRHTDLSIILFSGFSFEEIQNMLLGNKILAFVDVLIAGRYQHEKRLGLNLLGSTNQTIHLFSQRYSKQDLEVVPHGEIIIDANAMVCSSGFLSNRGKI
ncbi:MAG: 4Fe-4S single cluster domain-containing protein [bacterium]|nr:4Fe-4S single cluster domain-containing protein [bacterium]